MNKQRDPFFTEMVKRKSGAHKDKKRASKQSKRKAKHKGRTQ